MTLQDQLAATLVRCKAGESLDSIAADRRAKLDRATALAVDVLREAGLSDEAADAAGRNVVWTLHLAGML